jgi:3-oxosteroid 1-dehydrogenase
MGRTYPGPGGTLGPAIVFGYLASKDMAERRL